MARSPRAQDRSKARSNADLLLSVTPAGAPPAVHQPPRDPPAQLWLCLYLPQLPLEAQAARTASAAGSTQPLAICAEEGRRTLIVTVNAEAGAGGVRPGMPVNSALALVPQLRLENRSLPLEAAALSRVARFAARFTPAVSMIAVNALVLEVRGSLRLFGGLEALRLNLARGLNQLGHQARISAAPTARAALWLARAGMEQPVESAVELRQVLAAVPVSQLDWPERTVHLLLQMGIATVGDCLRLPRDGFARRLGPLRLRELDQALGQHPEPQRPHVPPARFSSALELPAETIDAALLREGFQQLFRDLKQALVSRQAGVRRVWCRLGHPDGSETRLCLGLRQAAGQAAAEELLPGLLRLRLESLALPGRVTSLALQADLESGQAPAGTDLLGQSILPDDGLRGLLERLRTRLGAQAVQGLALRAEHRPENAWRPVADPLAQAADTEPLVATRSRPVWLLEPPEQLGLVAGQPAWRGALCLVQGPERIESGWWDGGDVRRDYYRASNAHGAMLWVYQDLRGQGWFLQGVFG